MMAIESTPYPPFSVFSNASGMEDKAQLNVSFIKEPMSDPRLPG